MKKFIVLKNKHGDVSYYRRTQKHYPDCEIILETDTELTCQLFCAIINLNNKVLGNDISEAVKEAAEVLGLDTDDFDELQKAIKMSVYDWNLN